MKELETPISDEAISGLEAGDMVYLSGTIYTARDAAHKKLAEIIEGHSAAPLSANSAAGLPACEKLPFDFSGQIVFYAGPAPAKPGKPIGSVGPTTAGRMDLYSPLLISQGLKLMIGKGLRSKEVAEAIIKYSGVYFAAIGGVAALMAKCVKTSKVIAFPDLGTEAVAELVVEKFPLVVAIDCKGRSLYETGRQKYYKA